MLPKSSRYRKMLGRWIDGRGVISQTAVESGTVWRSATVEPDDGCTSAVLTITPANRAGYRNTGTDRRAVGLCASVSMIGRGQGCSRRGLSRADPWKATPAQTENLPNPNWLANQFGPFFTQQGPDEVSGIAGSQLHLATSQSCWCDNKENRLTSIGLSIRWC